MSSIRRVTYSPIQNYKGGHPRHNAVLVPVVRIASEDILFPVRQHQILAVTTTTLMNQTVLGHLDDMHEFRDQFLFGL